MKNTYKSIKEVNLDDDFLFARVMGDQEICRRVLEKILGIAIQKVEIVDTQRTIDVLFEGKGIRLDVYVNDEKGTVYNVEMQRGKKKELPKRFRYYQGSMDLDLITSGQSYTNLKKTYIIFICTFDPFAEKRHIYTFENQCKEEASLLLGDETTKVFLNTKGQLEDVDVEMKEFLAYIEHTTDTFAEQTESSLVQMIHKKVMEIRESKEMEVAYMTLFQRDQENREEGLLEGREEGIELGLELGREEGFTLGREQGVLIAARIIKLYSSGQSSNEIAETLEIDIKFVEEIIRNYETD